MDLKKYVPRDWYRDPVFLGAGALGAALVSWILFPKQTRKVVLAVKDPIVRGGKLTSSTLDVNGVVQQSPDDLLSAASLALGFQADQDTYSAARLARSEGINEGAARILIGLNEAKSRGTSLTGLVTNSTQEWARGYYGKQASKPIDGVTSVPHGARGSLWSVRYCSTSEDPYNGDYQLAAQTLADYQAGIDSTGGAVGFLDKSSFKAQAGTSGTADQKIAEWESKGLVAFTDPAYGDDFVMFRKV